MGENIAKSGNISPRYVRVFSIQLSQICIAKALANDFQVAQHCVLRLLIIK